MTVKGLRFNGGRKSEVVDFPDELPGAGEVLVRLRASGLCGSDLHRYRADPTVQAPLKTRPGHEPCGEVVELGKGVTRVRVGDRIMQHHYLGCMECNYCRTGWAQLCPVVEKRRYYGGSNHGGHGEFMVAH